MWALAVQEAQPGNEQGADGAPGHPSPAGHAERCPHPQEPNAAQHMAVFPQRPLPSEGQTLLRELPPSGHGKPGPLWLCADGHFLQAPLRGSPDHSAGGSSPCGASQVSPDTSGSAEGR